MCFLTTDFAVYRLGLLKRNRNHSHLHQKIFKRTNGLRTDALLWFISDIHRVCYNLENPVDVRYEPQQGKLRSSSQMFFKFSDENLGSDIDPF